MRSLFASGALALALLFLAHAPPALADPRPDTIAQLGDHFDVAPAEAVEGADPCAFEAKAEVTQHAEFRDSGLPRGSRIVTRIHAPVTLATGKPRLRSPNVSGMRIGWRDYFGRTAYLDSMPRIQVSRFDPAAISLRRSTGV